MAEVVKTTSNVAFQHPLCRRTMRQAIETLFDGVGGRTLRPEATGVRVCQGLRNRFQSELPQSLHRSAPYAWDSQRTPLSIALGNVDPPQRHRAIAAMSQRQHSLPSGRRGQPDFPVYPRRSLASVFRHSLDGQHLAAVRAGQQALQGFRLAPPAFPYCFGDTHLEPLHLCLDMGPVCLFPHLSIGRGRTNARCFHIARRHLPFFIQRLIIFSRHE